MHLYQKDYYKFTLYFQQADDSKYRTGSLPYIIPLSDSRKSSSSSGGSKSSDDPQYFKSPRRKALFFTVYYCITISLLFHFRKVFKRFNYFANKSSVSSNFSCIFICKILQKPNKGTIKSCSNKTLANILNFYRQCAPSLLYWEF